VDFAAHPRRGCERRALEVAARQAAALAAPHCAAALQETPFRIQVHQGILAGEAAEAFCPNSCEDGRMTALQRLQQAAAHPARRVRHQPVQCMTAMVLLHEASGVDRALVLGGRTRIGVVRNRHVGHVHDAAVRREEIVEARRPHQAQVVIEIDEVFGQTRDAMQ